MANIVNVLGMKQLLGHDLGESAFTNVFFNIWFDKFNNKPAVGFGDLSFTAFSSLPYLKGGVWSSEINSALQAAKWTTTTSMTPGSLNSIEERMLSAGKDFWLGSTSADRVSSGGGSDVLALGAGDDAAYGGSGQDLMFGESGSDSLTGGAGSDTLFGGVGRDLLYGWGENDLIFGGTGNDGIYGNEGSDTIFGGDGTDYICGGSDKDVLYGGAGADTFAFRGQAANSVTIIKDFDILQDRQLIMASVAGDQLRAEMIHSYADGLMIAFSDGKAIYYQDVFDTSALLARMALFE